MILSATECLQLSGSRANIKQSSFNIWWFFNTIRWIPAKECVTNWSSRLFVKENQWHAKTFFCETHEICLVRWRHKRPLSRLKNGYAIQKMLDKLYAKYTRQDVDSHKQALIYMFHDSVCPSAYCSSEPFFKGMLEWAEEFLYQRFGKCLSCMGVTQIRGICAASQVVSSLTK